MPLDLDILTDISSTEPELKSEVKTEELSQA